MDYPEKAPTPEKEARNWRMENHHFDQKAYGETKPGDEIQPLTLPAYNGLEDMVEAIHRDGFIVLPEVLNRDEVAQRKVFMDSLADPDDSKYDVPKWCYNRSIGNQFHKHPEFLDLIDREPVVDVAQGVLGEGMRCRGGVMWVTGPGRSMGLHADWIPVGLPTEIAMDPRVKVPAFWLQAHYYLNDLTLDMGPTTIVPGSHRAGRPPVNETSFNGVDAVAAVVPAGSLVMFRSELWHGGHMHTADERRYIIQLQYTHSTIATPQLPRWQDEEAWNPEVRERATPRQRRLLGAPAHKKKKNEKGVRMDRENAMAMG